jgi:hypothetical protein
MKNYADQAVADYVAESVLERDPQWNDRNGTQMIEERLSTPREAKPLHEQHRRNCEHCGRSFECRRVDAKFCCATCRQSAYRHRCHAPKEASLRAPGERPADLLFWLRDGLCCRYKARVTADTEVSIGRTDSKRALGFVVTSGNKKVDFVLDRDQVAELAAFLRLALPGLRKPPGRKPPQVSLVALEAKGTPILDKGRETISAVDQPVRRGRPRRGEEGNALMQARPWKSAGVSRATWHRRRASTPR